MSTLTLESEVLKEEEEHEGQSVSEVQEIKMCFEDEDENEVLGDFSDTNCESIVLYR